MTTSLLTLSRLIVLAITVTAILRAVPLDAAQPGLLLQIRDGRVTLRAEGVSIRQILGRWAEVGQTTIVNGDKVPEAQVTLQLDDVSEDEALATLLRNVGGYILARRSVSGGAGWIDRVVIVPTQAAPSTVTRSLPPAPLSQIRRPGTIVPAPEQTESEVAGLDPSGPQEPENSTQPDVDERPNGSREAVELPRRGPMGRFGQPLGVVSGPEGANMPVAGAADASDMNRYEGRLDGPGAPNSGSIGVGPNPFGVNSGSAVPGPPRAPAAAPEGGVTGTGQR
jgi:hypothetical protein